MKTNSSQAAQVKSSIDKLILSATNKDFDILESIYHDSMTIYMLDGNNDLHQMNKAQFKDHVTASTNAAEVPQDWAKYHLVEADETNGHVIISRKVNLTGELQIVTLSIDLIFEEDRWQITREVIFAGSSQLIHENH